MQVDGIISEYKEQGQRGARIRSRPSSHTLRWINRTRPCSRRNQLKFPSQIKDSHELSTQHLAQANTCPGLFEMRVVSSHTAAPSIECVTQATGSAFHWGKQNSLHPPSHYYPGFSSASQNHSGKALWAGGHLGGVALSDTRNAGVDTGGSR